MIKKKNCHMCSFCGITEGKLQCVRYKHIIGKDDAACNMYHPDRDVGGAWERQKENILTGAAKQAKHKK